jgi:hypothetical protein
MDPEVNPIADATSGKPRRYRRWVIGVLAGLLLIAGFVPVVQVAVWIGSREVPLVFSVADSASSRPVAGAIITVYRGASDVGVGMAAPAPDPSDSRTRSISTGDDGKANGLFRIDAHGRRSWISDWGRIHFVDYYVRVTATGFEPTQFRLDERIGKERDIHDDSAIELFVQLNPARQDAPEGIE